MDEKLKGFVGVKQLLPDYVLRGGSTQSRSLLIQFLKTFYQEIFPENQKLNKQAEFYVSRFLDLYYVPSKTPFLWVEPSSVYPQKENVNIYTPIQEPIACLLLGEDMNIFTGENRGYIFFLYVKPDYRCRGIGTALIEYGAQWSLEQGYDELSLGGFVKHERTLNLYRKFGFTDEQIIMIKCLKSD